VFGQAQFQAAPSAVGGSDSDSAKRSRQTALSVDGALKACTTTRASKARAAAHQ